MFINYLRQSDPKAFQQLLDGIFGGGGFKAAFEASYGASVAAKWRAFAQTVSAQ